MVEGRDGEADSVDGDGTLHDGVAVEVGREPDLEPPIPIRESLEIEKFGGAVDMTLYDVPAQALTHRNRTFQIDKRCGLQFSEVRASQRLRRKIHPEAVRIDLHRGEACAVYGDTRSGIGVRQNGLTQHFHTRARLRDLADFLYDSGEHY